LVGYADRNLMHKILELERFGFILVILLLITGIFETILVPSVNFLSRILLGLDIFG
jgi:hypothetical protein